MLKIARHLVPALENTILTNSFGESEQSFLTLDGPYGYKVFSIIKSWMVVTFVSSEGIVF